MRALISLLDRVFGWDNPCKTWYLRQSYRKLFRQSTSDFRRALLREAIVRVKRLPADDSKRGDEKR